MSPRDIAEMAGELPERTCEVHEGGVPCGREHYDSLLVEGGWNHPTFTFAVCEAHHRALGAVWERFELHLRGEAS